MRRRAPDRVALASALLLLTRWAAGAVQIGAVVPDFGMTTLEGRRFSLTEAEKTHSGVVILFLSTICPYSNYYNDLIRDLSREFEKKGVVFVGVNSGKLETAEEARVHAREHGHAFDIIKDSEGRLADLLDARRTPEVFLLDSSGTLRYHGRIASKISAPDLKNALDALLDGPSVPPRPRPSAARSRGASPLNRKSAKK